MPIFSAFLKSPPESPSGRTVPWGGLGGLVEIKGGDRKVKSPVKVNNDAGNQQSRKKPPPPIRVNSIEVLAPTRSAPADKVLHTMPRTSPTSGMKVATTTAMAIMVGEDGHVQDLSSRLFWQRTKTPNSAMPALTSRNTPMSSPKKHELVAVELPGSLLLPDRGLTSHNTLRISSRQGGRARAYSDRSAISTIPKFVATITPPALEMEAFKSVLRSSHKKQQSPSVADIPSAPQTATVTSKLIASPSLPELRTQNLNSLSADELLRILPKMKNKAIVEEWIPAMEKEFAKHMALIEKIRGEKDQQIDRNVATLGEDLQGLLTHAQQIAGQYSETVEEAQRAIDANKQSDNEKLRDTQIRLQDMLMAFNNKVQQKNAEYFDYLKTKQYLHETVVTLSGFIKNNLAHLLHHSDEGLTPEVIKIIQAFPRDVNEGLNNIETVSINLFQETYNSLLDTQKRVEETQALVKEQRSIGKETAAQLDRVLNQLEAVTVQKNQQNSRILLLEQQLATEKEQNERHRARIQHYENANSSQSPPFTPKDDNFDSKSGNLQSVLQQRTRELEERDLLIRQQQAKIDSFLRKDTGSADHANVSPVTPVSPPTSTTSQPLSSKKNFSKKFKSAVLPISKSVNNLLTPLDYDSVSPADQPGLKTQPSRASLSSAPAASPVVTGPNYYEVDQRTYDPAERLEAARWALGDIPARKSRHEARLRAAAEAGNAPPTPLRPHQLGRRYEWTSKQMSEEDKNRLSWVSERSVEDDEGGQRERGE